MKRHGRNCALHKEKNAINCSHFINKKVYDIDIIYHYTAKYFSVVY